MTLMVLKELNHEWARQMDDLLERWGLERDWENIQANPKNHWKKKVKEAAEIMNKEKIREECGARIRGEVKQKTRKTRTIESVIDDSEYRRKPDEFIVNHQSISFARAYIMGRYGMLDCANNFSNKYGGKMCRKCRVVDDEKHRINECVLYESMNWRNRDIKVNFEDILCKSDEKVLNVVQSILSMWDLERGRNVIRTANSA